MWKLFTALAVSTTTVTSAIYASNSKSNTTDVAAAVSQKTMKPAVLKEHPVYQEMKNSDHLKKLRKFTIEERERHGFKGQSFTADNKVSMVYFWNTSEKLFHGLVHFSKLAEGPIGCAHGGSIATVLDESFGRTVFEAEGIAVTANLNVNYKKFVPLDSTKKIEAKIDRVEGKKVFVSGKIVDPVDGTVHSEGTALFIKYDYSKHASKKD
jgi:hypothetical protein